MSVEVRVDPGRIARLLRLRGGRVERKLRERTARVARIAEAEAPGSMGRYISWDIVEGPCGLDGTRPHLIRPRRRNGVLRFVVDGQVVYSAYARHPGSRPNNFLARALRLGR